MTIAFIERPWCKLRRASRARNDAARRLPRMTLLEPSCELQPACRHDAGQFSRQLGCRARHQPADIHTKVRRRPWQNATMAYWLAEWLDTFGISSVKQARVALRDKPLREDFMSRAAVARDVSVDPGTLPTDLTLLAGRRIDLSCDLDVYDWKFLQRRVDELFIKVWHYFDKIVVVGADAGDFDHVWKEDEKFERRALLYVRLILYLREIGAEPLVVFTRKPHVHVDTSDPTIKIPLLGPEREHELLNWMSSEGSIRLTQDGCVHPGTTHYHYTYDWPGVDHTQWGVIEGVAKELPPATVERQVQRAILARYAALLASDIAESRRLSCGLGVGVDVHARMLDTQAPSSPTDVALNIQLPILRKVTARDLLRLRADEQDAFVAFRAALRTAINERLKSSAPDMKTVAQEVQRDVIDPAIHDVERRLRTAGRALLKKSALRGGVGALATVCGVMFSLPLLATAGAGAVLGAFSALDSFTDARREVQLSDMYFAWKARTM